MFDKNLIAIHNNKVKLRLNKTSNVGICTLNLSKYRNKARLLFTDTDSLIFQIKTEDIYENFGLDKEMFDFINYSAK